MVRDRALGSGGVMFSGRLCWWVVVLGGVFAGQGCSLGIVVVVPGNSGNTSGDGLGEGCVLGGRGVSRIPLRPLPVETLVGAFFIL